MRLKEKNVGDATAGAHETQLYLSTDKSITNADVPLGTPFSFGAIAAGDSLEVDQTLVVPDLEDGNYYVGIHVDINSTVEESDEYNTYYRTKPVEVSDGLDPVITSAPNSVYATLTEGEHVTTTLTIRNEGVDVLDWSLTIGDAAGTAEMVVQQESVVRSVLPSNFDALAKRAQERGSVPVIVGFEIPKQTAGPLAGNSSELITQQKIASKQSALLREVEAHGLSKVKRFSYIPFVAMHASEEALRQLAMRADVTSIREDRAVPALLEKSTSLIGMNEAWSSGYSGERQAVAILDTGVDSDHPFLDGKVVAEACFSTTNSAHGTQSLCPDGSEEQVGSGAAEPCDGICSHGTSVAGIAAGRSESFSGVAKDAGIVAVQVFSDFGYGPRAYNSDIIKGLEYVYSLRESHTIASVNMSLGSGRYTSECDSKLTAMVQAIDNLRSVGIATVVSSGNNGYSDSIGFPACISSAVSVGSTDSGSEGTVVDAISGYSNSAEILDLLAPGQWINSPVPGGGYGSFNGTSAAAPHVAGAWAVLKEQYPHASVDQILTRLSSSGVPITDSRNNITKPRIQVDAALEAPMPWVTVSKLGGRVEPGGETNVTVMLDASTQRPGSYTSSVTLRSNDPNQPVVRVPVEMVVEYEQPVPPIDVEAMLIEPEQVQLNWQRPSEGNNRSWVLFRDTTSAPVTVLDTVSVWLTTYVDSNLTQNERYYYRLAALGPAGTMSTYSEEAAITTGDVTSPQPPSDLRAERTGPVEVALSWSASTSADVVRQVLYRRTHPDSLTAIDTLAADLQVYADSSLKEETTYYYRLSAVDGANNVSVLSDPISVTTGDATPPAAPTELAAAAGEGRIDLAWQASSDADLMRYYIYRDAAPEPTTLVDSVGALQAAYADTTLENGQTYYYRVAATDSAGNRSAYSNEVSAHPEDLTAPEPPSGLAASLASPREVALSWSSSASADVVSQVLYRHAHPDSLAAIDTLAADLQAYADTSVQEKATYYYRLAALDGAGNASSLTDAVSVATGDATPPAAPAELTAAASDGRVDLRWRAPSDADLMRYYIYRNTAPEPTTLVDSVEAEQNAYADTSLTNGEIYYYRVAAADSAGNHSAYSNEMSAYPEDRKAPEPPSDLMVSLVSPTEVALTWSTSASVDVVSQVLYRHTHPDSLAAVDTLASDLKSYADTSVLEKSTYYYRLASIDGSGNVSSPSQRMSVVTGDATPPDAPRELAVRPRDARNDLEWEGSSSSDVAQYRIYRDVRPEPETLIDTVSVQARAYADEGLANGSTYFYRITAVDSSGNESAFSNEMSGSPWDQTPPEAPAELAASSDSVHTIDIRWSPAPDPDVHRYRIYRDTTEAPDLLIDSTAADVHVYTDGDRKRSTTYYYRITAVDSTGNESGFSIEASVTTPTGVALSGGEELPGEFRLEPNYPNPFSQSTTLRIGLPRAERVTMTIYDLTGRRVAELLSRELPAGWHEVTFRAGRLPSGAYLCRVVTDSGHSRTLKMVLLR